MALTVQDGKLVFRDGAIGTEQACCCAKCTGPCDEENPCPEGCICCNGECVKEIPEGECCGPCQVCEGECEWTNDPGLSDSPAQNGWYLVSGCAEEDEEDEEQEEEEGCGCEPPEEEAPEYDPDDPEGTVAFATTECVAENPCPEGCECVDGECVPNCSIKSCSIVPGPGGWPTVMPAGDCGDNNDPGAPECCCIGWPQTVCFEEEILDEQGNVPGDANEWRFKGACVPCCSGTFYEYSIQAGNGLADADLEQTEQWIENVRDLLANNGFTNVTSYSRPCANLTEGEQSLVWVWACCDGMLTCSQDPSEADCLDGAQLPSGATPVFSHCSGNCIPVCEPNPLP